MFPQSLKKNPFTYILLKELWLSVPSFHLHKRISAHLEICHYLINEHLQFLWQVLPDPRHFDADSRQNRMTACRHPSPAATMPLRISLKVNYATEFDNITKKYHGLNAFLHLDPRKKAEERLLKKYKL